MAEWSSHHLDHDLVQEVVSSNPAVARKCINLFNYLFDLFIYFSHLLVTKTSPLCVKRQEMMKTVEFKFKAYVELIAYIQIQTLRDS